MKRLSRVLRGVLGVVSLGVLTLILALVFSGLRGKQAPAVSQSPLPTPFGRGTAAVLPTVTPADREMPSPTATPKDETFKSPLPTPTTTFTPVPSPTLSPTSTPGKPTPTVPVPALDDYVFGEPTVVLTHTSGIGIVRWLPDGERLLVVRTIPGKPREYVETLDVRIGELYRYGERHNVSIKPVWLDRLGKVAFADTADRRRDLWISGYDQEKATEATLADIHYPMAGAGDVVWIVPSNQQSLIAAGEEGRRQDIPAVDLAVYGFEPDDVLTYFRMVIAPDEGRLAAYDRERFVILDLKTGSGWPIDLGTKATEGSPPIWAYHAEWSPDGRYLALVTSVGDLPFDFTDLTIVDTHTGEVKSMHPEQYVNRGQYYVTDVAWSPNSRIIAARVALEAKEGVIYEVLYLVDTVTGQNKRVLPQTVFAGGNSGWAIEWSPDGRQIILSCPTKNEGRLCLISVAVRQ